jgi:hypothetical protein
MARRPFDFLEPAVDVRQELFGETGSDLASEKQSSRIVVSHNQSAEVFAAAVGRGIATGVRIFIDDLGGVFRPFLKQGLYESFLVAFIGAVIPSDWNSLFHGSEHPG